MTPKLKMVTHHHIKHKPIGSKDFPLIQEFRKGTNLHIDEDDENYHTSGILSPLASFLFTVSGTGQCISC